MARGLKNYRLKVWKRGKAEQWVQGSGSLAGRLSNPRVRTLDFGLWAAGNLSRFYWDSDVIKAAWRSVDLAGM